MSLNFKYAEVAVDFPAAPAQTYTYAIPEALPVELGQVVWVPFGPRLLQGAVVEITDFSTVEGVKPVAGVIHPHPLLSPAQLTLARWLSTRYLSSLYDALALMLPPGLASQAVPYIEPGEKPAVALSSEEEQLLALVRQRGAVARAALEKSSGLSDAKRVVNRLLRRGLLRLRWETPRPRIGPKQVRLVRLLVTAEQAQAQAEQRQKRAPRQAEVLRLLAQRGTLPLEQAKKELKINSLALQALAQQGLVKIESMPQPRTPAPGIPNTSGLPQTPPPLNPDQQRVLATIKKALDGVSETTGTAPVPFLLKGVTGSGKTEVYLRALEHSLARGKRGIVLVPEIALTPQTIDRFSARFPGRVAVLHSRLTLREQYEAWWGIREGQYDVVIGPRSALFAPQPDLGLIVLDEEHEWTYKESERPPRFHSREVALKLSELSGAVVLLGSATPAVESYHRARHDEFRLLELKERVSPASLPRVQVVDLRQELKQGNRSPLSRSLTQSLNQCLAKGEQAILFLNRRGAATLVRCRKCGLVIECRRCALSLTYHRSAGIMLCHQCGYKIRAPSTCPHCGAPALSYFGLGTERLQEELNQLFPAARLLRWDSDAVRGQAAQRAALARFTTGEADILIGTQMIAKGLDFPRVTLVGVILADLGLYFPDFRCAERIFQLLSQVSGRAGRGALPGEVIIQTYNAEHYVVQAAARQSYELFFGREIAYRRRYGYPPFSHLVRLVYANTNASRCQGEAERMRQRLEQGGEPGEMNGIEIIGPAPCFISRLRGKFRWQLVVKCADGAGLPIPLPLPPGWTVDVDPVNLL